MSVESAVQLRLKAAGLFEQATRIAPRWAHAWAYRARALRWAAASTYSARADSLYRLAISAADRAIELDPDDAVAHAARGFILARLWEWDAAEGAYRVAARLSPNSIGHGLPLLYLTLDRPDEAIAAYRYLIVRDPLSVTVRVNFAWALACAGRYTEALALFDIAEVQSLQGWERSRRANVLLRAGRFEAAVADFEESTRAGAYPPDGMALAYARVGDTRRAREIVQARRQRLRDVHRNNREWYSRMGALADDLALDDRGRLTERLQSMYDARDQYLPLIRCEPYYADLLGIPEARAILEKMGLPL